MSGILISDEEKMDFTGVIVDWFNYSYLGSRHGYLLPNHQSEMVVSKARFYAYLLKLHPDHEEEILSHLLCDS